VCKAQCGAASEKYGFTIIQRLVLTLMSAPHTMPLSGWVVFPAYVDQLSCLNP